MDDNTGELKRPSTDEMDLIAHIIFFGSDEDFAALLDRLTPCTISPETVCTRCGARRKYHKYNCICLTEEYGLFTND